MAWLFAVRTRLPLIVAAWLLWGWGPAEAVPVSAIEPGGRVFAEESQASPFEPSPFAISGLHEMDDLSAAREAPSIQLNHPSDPAANLLILMMRANTQAREAERQDRIDALLRGELPPRQGADVGLHMIEQAYRSSAHRAAPIGVNAAAWTSLGVGSDAAQVGLRPAQESAAQTPLSRMGAIPADLLRPPPIKLWPWICFLLGLVAIAWLGWRTAA